MANGNELPEPIAQGELTRTPFAHLLLYVQRRVLSGTLVIWDPANEGRPTQERIRFDAGVPVAARLAYAASRLDRGLLQLFPRMSGPYAFYEAIDLVGTGDNVLVGRTDILPLVAASLRGSSREDAVDHVVASLGQSKMRCSPGVDVPGLGLLPEEHTLLDVLRAEPATVEEMIQVSPLDARMVRRLVYFFVITKTIEPYVPEVRERAARTPGRMRSSMPVFEPSSVPPPGRSSLPPPKSSDRPPPMPHGLSGQHQAFWAEILERTTAIDTENFFQVLGVSQKATEKDIQSAYYGLVKKWHPDRLPAELQALRPRVEDIFRLLTRAQDTLMNPIERVKYVAAVESGGGTLETERQVGAIISAAMEFRKVEVMMQRREWASAKDLIEQIIAVADDDADYHAARGWVLFRAANGAPSAEIEVLKSLDRALELNEDNDKAHYYKGMVLKKQGDMDAALKHFKSAARLNKRNIEAAREVRLANLRGGKSDSLLDKFFGSSKKS